MNTSTDRDYFKTLVRAGATCVVLVCGLVALKTLASALNWRIDKPPVPLRIEFSKFPLTLGEPSKYEAVGSDQFMKPDEVQTLGTDQYLLRDYKDVAKRDRPARANPKEAGDLRLNLNYYPAGTGTVHVPDICWTASGLVRDMSVGDLAFVVKDVKLADGSMIDLPVRMLAFKPRLQDLRLNPDWAKDERNHLLCVAYTFNVNGEYVSNRYEVMQKFWKTDLPFAYHAKIEVKIAERCSPEEAQPIVEAFLREVMPEVSRCLPDINELKAKAAAPATTQSAQTEPAKHAAPKP